MDKLPTEIISQILELVEGRDGINRPQQKLALCATVSKWLQMHIEARTFRHLHMDVLRLAHFKTIMNERRLLCIKMLTFSLDLPLVWQPGESLPRSTSKTTLGWEMCLDFCESWFNLLSHPILRDGSIKVVLETGRYYFRPHSRGSRYMARMILGQQAAGKPLPAEYHNRIGQFPELNNVVDFRALFLHGGLHPAIPYFLATRMRRLSCLSLRMNSTWPWADIRITTLREGKSCFE